MTALFIVDKPDKTRPNTVWPESRKATEDMSNKCEPCQKPADNVFLLEMQNESHIVGTLIQEAVHHQLSYRLLLFDNVCSSSWSSQNIS